MMVFSHPSQITPRWTVGGCIKGTVLAAHSFGHMRATGGGVKKVKLLSRRGVVSPEADQGTEVDMSTVEDP